MAADDLGSFDIYRFVRMLNGSLPAEYGAITLGGFEPPREPFWKRFGDGIRSHVVGMIGVHQLRRQQMTPQSEPWSKKGVVGYAQLESGDIGRGDEPEGRYNSLVLRVSSPITLSNGLVVPDCRISMYHEFEEMAEPYRERTDKKKFLGVLWRKTDLESVLPTDWFLTEWFIKRSRDGYHPKKSSVSSR